MNVRSETDLRSLKNSRLGVVQCCATVLSVEISTVHSPIQYIVRASPLHRTTTNSTFSIPATLSTRGVLV